ncbi:GNAT family N-acetyltransferase [Paenibacillus sp. TSA_86.1]|uniref:GNAT family N-acetyltransferase n=1 Tax=Paenibacillus sp. TSA_86.1 TaxID=3415649 RepID=UPI004045C27A
MIREAEVSDAAAIEGLYRELLPNRTDTVVLAERIEEMMQGKGYGTELMEHLEHVCVQMNALKMLLASGATRYAAHQFYKKLGYDG